MIHRFQIQFYGLFLNYVRRDKENFWKDPLKNIKDDTLTDFEKRIREKYPTAYNVMEKYANSRFTTKINRIVNETFYRDFFRQLRDKTKIYQIQCFTMAGEAGGFFNKITPFRKVNNKWDLKPPYDGDYFPMFRRFNVIADKQGIRICWVYIPGKYFEHIFLNNCNGIRSAWIPEARLYLRPLFRKWRKILTAVYENQNLYGKTSNEVPYSSHMDGVIKNNQHIFFYDCMKEVIPINRTISDISHSDFNQLAETEYYCKYKTKDGKVETKIVSRKTYQEIKREGRLIQFIARIGRDDLDRKNILEWHGWFPDKFDKPIHDGAEKSWIDIMTKTNHRNFLLSTDGTTEGSGSEYIGGTYRNLDKAEIEELLDRGLEIAAANGRFVMIADLPKEPFRKINNRIIEDETLFDFDRLIGLESVWKKYFK